MTTEQQGVVVVAILIGLLVIGLWYISRRGHDG